MAADEKWYFTKEQLSDTPSRKCGIDADKELSYRQQAANFIQDMGQRLVVCSTQLCINTAIVYMHRFYVFHSLSQFHRNAIAAAALFLAAKVEEQPRKLEHVIKVAHMCLHRDQNAPDTKSEQYLDQAQDLVFNENVLLQTLGFDVAIDHPHTHVVRCCHLVKASKDLAQTSYFMASNSLHLTTMCLQYKPTVVACFCIHLACKWSNWEIPQSNEGKHWFWYVDRSVTAELLQQLTAEFLHIFDKCPSRLKKKIKSISDKQSSTMHHPSIANSPFDVEPRKVHSQAADGGPTFQSQRIFAAECKDETKKPSTSSTQRPQPEHYREYREKKDRERLEREKMAGVSGAAPPSHPPDNQKHHSHHHKQGTTSSSISAPSKAAPGKHQVPSQKPSVHHNHHRPDHKPQQYPSISPYPRDPSRDRPRLPTAAPGYTHGQGPSVVTDSSTGNAETPQNLQDISQTQSNPADRLGNNNYNNAQRAPQQHEKRGYDPSGHKVPEHRREAPKSFPKFNEQVRQDRPQPKVDPIELRNEEVRKIIEKPIPIPKPRAEVQKEEFIASMLKQSHHPSKYLDKLPTAHNTARNPSSAFPHDFSKNLNLSKQPQQQVSTQHTSNQPLNQQHIAQQQQQQHLHGVTQNLKDIKNGNSNISLGSGNNVDDPKAEKRPRSEDFIVSQPAPIKHKSLFSPEKGPTPQPYTAPTNRDLHSQRTKSFRQKTPPVSVVPIKAIKRERTPELQMPSNLISPFASPPATLESQLTAQSSSQSHPPVKRMRTSSTSTTSTTRNDPEQVKVKIEETSGYESMKMLGRVPDLIQPIRDNPGSTNGRMNLVANDLKPPELIRPFEPDTMDSRHLSLTNGLDSVNIESEPLLDQLALERLEKSQLKSEYLSPMKSAQSISALLQEPLAPMPSLLDSSLNMDSGNYSFSQTSSIKNTNNINSKFSEALQVPQTSQIPLEQQVLVKEEPFIAPPTSIDTIVHGMPIPVPTDITKINNNSSGSSHPAVFCSQDPVKPKSDHHKSEKKKKKEKHKHKDKSKEKHKHKHKEKHRENAAAPIKITIPKDKLNMISESSNTSNMSSATPLDKKNPHGTSLKIKIAKDKLTGVAPVEQTQGPLKLKIRKTGSTVGSSSSEIPESRKRERERDPLDVLPAMKKAPASGVYQQTFGGQQQRPPTERQNGRHYSSTSKQEKHSSREHKSTSKLPQTQQSHTTT